MESYLQERKFRQTVSDQCLLFCNGEPWIIIYADEIVLIGPCENEIYRIERVLRTKLGVKYLGVLTHFLRFDVQKTPKGITLPQEFYTLNVFERFNIRACKPVATPARSVSN